MKKQRSSGYVMDGFVPRRRSGPVSKRPTLDQQRLRKRHKNVASQPLSIDGSTEKTQRPQNRMTDTWLEADETVVIDPDDLVDSRNNQEPPTNTTPRWWQIRKKRAARKKGAPVSRKKSAIKRVGFAGIAIVFILGGFLGWKFLRNMTKVFDGNVLGFFETVKLNGEDQGRVNILIAGTSEDDGPLHGGADLTDSIMLVSINTKDNTGFTMSIPRDTWVKYGEQCSAGYQGKINVVYQCGEDVKFSESGYPTGGMGLLQKIVSENFGIPIHYHTKISYNAFKDAVDAVGGIDVEINSENPRGIYDPNFQQHEGGPLRLTNGQHKLDGQTALRLARSRNSAGGYGMGRGDFDRTNYQQAMLLSLKDKALSAGVLANPAKIGELMDAAGENVSTNFQSSEVRRLYELSKLIQNDSVITIDLASEDIGLLTTGMYNEQSIVRPVAGLTDFSDIQSYLKKVMSNDPVVREGATVVVLNGSGVVGMAQKRADELTEKGLDVATVGNAESSTTTLIVDQSDGNKDGTKRVLEQHFNTVSTRQSNADAANYDADFVIILGQSAGS